MRVLLSFLLAAGAYAADVAGKWNVTAASPSGREYKLELEIKNVDGKLSGSMSSPQGSVELQNVELKGDELTYRLPTGDGGYAIKFTVTGDTMKGSYTAPDGTTGTANATRAGAAAAAPGGVAGKWKVIAKSNSGRQYDITLDVISNEGKLSGTLSTAEGTLPLTDARLEGDQFTFKLVLDEGSYNIKTTITGATMKGSYTGPNSETGEIQGSK